MIPRMKRSGDEEDIIRDVKGRRVKVGKMTTHMKHWLYAFRGIGRQGHTRMRGRRAPPPASAAAACTMSPPSLLPLCFLLPSADSALRGKDGEGKPTTRSGGGPIFSESSTRPSHFHRPPSPMVGCGPSCSTSTVHFYNLVGMFSSLGPFDVNPIGMFISVVPEKSWVILYFMNFNV